LFLIVFGVNGKKIIPKVLIGYISKRAIKLPSPSDPVDSKDCYMVELAVDSPEISQERM